MSRKLTVLVEDGAGLGAMKIEYTGANLGVVETGVEQLVAVVEQDAEADAPPRALFPVSRLIGVLYGEDVSL